MPINEAPGAGDVDLDPNIRPRWVNKGNCCCLPASPCQWGVAAQNYKVAFTGIQPLTNPPNGCPANYCSNVYGSGDIILPFAGTWKYTGAANTANWCRWEKFVGDCWPAFLGLNHITMYYTADPVLPLPVMLLLLEWHHYATGVFEGDPGEDCGNQVVGYSRAGAGINLLGATTLNKCVPLVCPPNMESNGCKNFPCSIVVQPQ